MRRSFDSPASKRPRKTSRRLPRKRARVLPPLVLAGVILTSAGARTADAAPTGGVVSQGRLSLSVTDIGQGVRRLWFNFTEDPNDPMFAVITHATRNGTGPPPVCVPHPPGIYGQTLDYGVAEDARVELYYGSCGIGDPDVGYFVSKMGEANFWY